MMNTIAVYGGAGALGRSLVKFFKEKNYRVISIDLVENSDADQNTLVAAGQSMESQSEQLTMNLNLQPNALDAILCVAGGWAGGNAASSSFLSSANLMIKQSVESSCVAAHLASKYLKTGGMLALTGAAAAAGPTPGMIGYGISKAAVHHLVHDLAQANSGLPDDSKVIGICPITIDTPMNRSGMPNADFSSWTPPEHIADQLFGYLTGTKTFTNGSLIKVETQEGKTTFESL